jgi:hypothetical protein
MRGLRGFASGAAQSGASAEGAWAGGVFKSMMISVIDERGP